MLNDFKELGCAFEVYDSFYPSHSDSDAYICYFYQGYKLDTFGVTLVNHGWSKGIFQIHEDIVFNQLLHIAKTKNSLKIEIEKAIFFIITNKSSCSVMKKIISYYQKYIAT